ncbi:MAG: hypothetical protein R2867_01500 [Caldilineaceae bacterium]
MPRLYAEFARCHSCWPGGHGHGDRFCQPGGWGETATSEFARCQPVAGVVNGYLQATGLTTHYDPTVPGAPAGLFTIVATFVNRADTTLNDLFFKVGALTNDDVLLNAAGTPAVLALCWSRR